jgi:hypothetical protein
MRRFKDLTRCYDEAGPAMGFADGSVACASSWTRTA